MGEGGFGVVYRAHHLWLDIPVALKALRVSPEWSAERQQRMFSRFLGEAQLLAQLRHPNIVSVLDTGVEPADGELEATPWLVTEWCEGVTLAQEIEDRAVRWSVLDAWSVLEPVLEALAHAHARGVAHRDLKPSNIMVVRDGARVDPRVVDFGVAKWLEGPGATALSGEDTAFTLAYAAPEQLARRPTGPWTDVHALGLLVCELLSGERAYRGESRQELLEAVRSPERPYPHGTDETPAALRRTLARALSLDPERRQPDAGALLAELRQLLPARAVSSDSKLSESTQISGEFSAEEQRIHAGRTHERASGVASKPSELLSTSDVGVLEQPSLPAAPQRWRWRPAAIALSVTALVALGGTLYDRHVRSLVRERDAAGTAPSASASAASSSTPTAAIATAHPADCFDPALLDPRAQKRGWVSAAAHPQNTWGIVSTTLTYTQVGAGLPRTAMVIFYRHLDKASQTLTLSYLNAPRYHVAVRGLCAVAVMVEPDQGEGDALLKDLVR